MVNRLIALNTKHFADRQKNNRGYAETQTGEQLDELLRQEWLRRDVADIRAGREEKKDWLPFICPHYTAFKDNHRAQDCIIPEAFTFMTCVDIDNPKLVRQAFERALEANKDELSEWHDMVLREAYSARGKGHIYIRIPKGMTIEEAQRAFCEEIGFNADELLDSSCFTPERYIYVTGIDQEVFRSEHWLEAIEGEELEDRREAYLQRGLDVDGRPLVLDSSGFANANAPSSCITNATEPAVESATSRTLYIFDACMKEAELTPDVLIVEGHRHEALKSILSVGATQLLKKEELMGVLQVRMAQNWQDKNIQQLVDDFYSKYCDPNQKMSQFQRKVLARSLRRFSATDERGLTWTGCDADEKVRDMPCQSDANNQQPPKMPKKLPKVVQLLTSKTPDIYKPAVAHAIFPPLGAHLWKVRFPYIDNVMHEATFMNVLMAGTGAGKDCISQPINHIMADIRKRDAENLKREADWKKEVNSKGSNKDKRQRPEGLVIQEVDPDMTNPAFVMRMAEAD